MSRQSMRLLITGAAGMLGSSVCPALREDGHEVLATDINTADHGMKYLDVRDYEEFRAQAAEFKPDMLLHLAAETDVERCEREPDHAYMTNTVGTQNAALICKNAGIPIVYISTAGVFDGLKEGFYHEFDNAIPINIYGKTKLEGEKLVESILPEHFIVRAGWMIGGGRKDKKFIMKIIQQLDDGKKELHAVDDKIGTPTYTKDFARTLRALIRTQFFGRYHMACTGSGTRYDVAAELLQFLGRNDVTLHRVKSDFFKTDYFAPRPRSEMMRNMMLDLRGLNTMRDWKIALREYLEEHFADRKHRTP